MATTLGDLVRVLDERTDAGRVRWHQLSDESYRTEVDAHSIRVGKVQVRVETEADEWDWVTGYLVTVTGPDGAIVDEDQFLDPPGGPSPAENLFKAARRSASGGDRVLGKLVEALQRNTN